MIVNSSKTKYYANHLKCPLSECHDYALYKFHLKHVKFLMLKLKSCIINEKEKMFVFFKLSLKCKLVFKTWQYKTNCKPQNNVIHFNRFPKNSRSIKNCLYTKAYLVSFIIAKNQSILFL